MASVSHRMEAGADITASHCCGVFHVTVQPKANVQHHKDPSSLWLLPSKRALHRQLTAVSLSVCSSKKRLVMSPWCTSSALQPGIVSSEAQLTSKVQLQQRAMWLSWVKYFCTAALDDRETAYLFAWTKRPEGKLWSWERKWVIS